MVFVWHPIIMFKCSRSNIIEQKNVEASNFHGNVGIQLKEISISSLQYEFQHILKA